MRNNSKYCFNFTNDYLKKAAVTAILLLMTLLVSMAQTGMAAYAREVELIQADPSEADGTATEAASPATRFDLEYTHPQSQKRLIVYDQEHLFSESEVRQFIESAEGVLQYGNVCILTCAQEDYRGYVGKLNDDIFGDGTDATTFMINMRPRQIAIYTEGKIKQTITAAKARSITDNIYRYASLGAYYECAAKALFQEERLLSGKGIWEPMKYIGDFFMAFTIGVILTFILTFVLRPKMKKGVVASENDALLSALAKQMTWTFSHQTKVYDPPSSSSSSGGGGGGGGGGDSGSFGGHSF